MRYSQIIGKTKKDAPKDEESISAQLLLRGGFIHKEIAGVYTYLPLGLRVLNKIVQIIREEMEAIDGQEMSLTALQNPEVWKKTGRYDDGVVDIWFKTKFKNGTETCLAITHEEPLTNLMVQQINSYKDLPLYAFQFQTKFRNEMRAKGGLLRVREFLMKDLYSFDKTKEDHEKYYERAKQAYIKIWERLGIGDETYITFASGGSFSKFSHEFQTVCETGEDTIYLDKKKKIAINKEVYNDEVLAELEIDKNNLEEVRAIEVGNIFPLGTKFSDALGLSYTDEDGEKKPVIMGSYGIGPGRVLATIVELRNDEKGIVWPENISPYKVMLVGLNLENEEVKKQAEELYEKLISLGIEVLYDDRKDVTAGQKFADCDLVGIPCRLVVSQKTEGKVEIKKRDENETKLLTDIELLNFFK
ncbi:prolyl-tRNA synthetase [Patescibacteria group bacterium]|nr:prolyl-tRNA synthetase [Patescibacteria group bacterium]